MPGPPPSRSPPRAANCGQTFRPTGNALPSNPTGWAPWRSGPATTTDRNCTQLTSLHGTAGTAHWSPDGRYIAFEFHPERTRGGLPARCGDACLDAGPNHPGCGQSRTQLVARWPMAVFLVRGAGAVRFSYGRAPTRAGARSSHEGGRNCRRLNRRRAFSLLFQV